jgi:hypothetical protein
LETFNFLHLAQVEVLGSFGVNSGVGRVANVNAGKDVTVAVIAPFSDPREAEAAYIKAVWCDPLNAEILRQFETYTLMYDNYGRGEVLTKCIICKERVKCEVGNHQYDGRVPVKAPDDCMTDRNASHWSYVVAIVADM